jgi:hypothetical protein
MITLHEAYLKAKDEGQKYGCTLLKACSDYGDFWGFCLWPLIEKELIGIGDITVCKKTGEIGNFYPTMDLDLFEKRKPVPLEQFAEYNVAI